MTGLTYKLGMSTLGTLTYGYDAAAGRTTVGGTYARTSLPAALTSATYDDANQIATFSGVSFTYDANGNLTSDGVRSYTWNPRAQLASVTGPVSGSFAYDGVGRRRSKTIGGTATQFLYDGLNPVQELAGGTPTANLLTGIGIDEHFTRNDSGDPRTYLTDALGSTVALADSMGVIQTEYTFQPYGGTTVSGAGTANAVGFTGRELDGTGLHYFRARYLDSHSQAFISEDPILFSGGDVNPYRYAGNSPMVFRDPLGLCVPCAAEAGAIAGGAVGNVPGAIVGGLAGAIAGFVAGQWIWDNVFANGFPDPLNPPSHWQPRGPDRWYDPQAEEWWRWHPDPTGEHGGDHWDVGGPRPADGGKGAQDWWPRGGDRAPKPPGQDRPKPGKPPAGQSGSGSGRGSGRGSGGLPGSAQGFVGLPGSAPGFAGRK